MAKRLEDEAILALGSNLGNRKDNLKRCIELIKNNIGEVKSTSSFLENAPVGFESKNTFVNMCIHISTKMTGQAILKEIKSIEKKMGREKSTALYEDRIIDVDIILLNSSVINQHDLIIPHPKYTQRAFVLSPMCEIGDYLDPNVFLTSKQLLK